MRIDRYLGNMGFHPKWREYGMLPEALVEQLCATYEPGMEGASEHDRNGVFHWWLGRSPDKEVLMKLVELSFVDPDQVMAEDVRRHIVQSASCDEEVARLIGDLRGSGGHG